MDLPLLTPTARKFNHSNTPKSSQNLDVTSCFSSSNFPQNPPKNDDFCPSGYLRLTLSFHRKSISSIPSNSSIFSPSGPLTLPKVAPNSSKSLREALGKVLSRSLASRSGTNGDQSGILGERKGMRKRFGEEIKKKKEESRGGERREELTFERSASLSSFWGNSRIEGKIGEEEGKSEFESGEKSGELGEIEERLSNEERGEKEEKKGENVAEGRGFPGEVVPEEVFWGHLGNIKAYKQISIRNPSEERGESSWEFYNLEKNHFFGPGRSSDPTASGITNLTPQFNSNQSFREIYNFMENHRKILQSQVEKRGKLGETEDQFGGFGGEMRGEFRENEGGIITEPIFSPRDSTQGFRAYSEVVKSRVLGEFGGEKTDFVGEMRRNEELLEMRKGECFEEEMREFSNFEGPKSDFGGDIGGELGERLDLNGEIMRENVGFFSRGLEGIREPETPFTGNFGGDLGVNVGENQLENFGDLRTQQGHFGGFFDGNFFVSSEMLSSYQMKLNRLSQMYGGNCVDLGDNIGNIPQANLGLKRRRNDRDFFEKRGNEEN